MTEAVIVDAVRTPGGKRNGMLKDQHPAALAAQFAAWQAARTAAAASPPGFSL